MAEKEDSATRRAREQAMEQAEQRKLDAAYERSRTTPYAKGGSASSRADGIAQRGKTRGTMVACGGGYMKAKK